MFYKRMCSTPACCMLLFLVEVFDCSLTQPPFEACLGTPVARLAAGGCTREMSLSPPSRRCRIRSRMAMKAEAESQTLHAVARYTVTYITTPLPIGTSKYARLGVFGKWTLEAILEVHLWTGGEVFESDPKSHRPIHLSTARQPSCSSASKRFERFESQIGQPPRGSGGIRISLMLLNKKS